MFAEIAAVLEACENPRPGLQYACTLAKDIGSRLTALYIEPEEPPPLGRRPAPASALVAADDRVLREAVHTAEMKKLLAELALDAGIEWKWQPLQDAATGRIARYARYHDMLMLFRNELSDEAAVSTVNVPGVVLESGRPTLVISALHPQPLFRRILIGWNGSREAARAVHDALPLLGRAERVIVAMAAEESLFQQEEEPGLDIGAHLARHGVRAEVERIEVPTADAGTILLSLANRMPADLIVAGCYGQMRLTEFLFGGVSRSLLREARIPLLLSY
ncbi:MAG TPA: universal stress protein [Rhodopila sp.]|nr:universal stress protein [Rhodopila sp.]